MQCIIHDKRDKHISWHILDIFARTTKNTFNSMKYQKTWLIEAILSMSDKSS